MVVYSGICWDQGRVPGVTGPWDMVVSGVNIVIPVVSRRRIHTVSVGETRPGNKKAGILASPFWEAGSRPLWLDSAKSNCLNLL